MTTSASSRHEFGHMLGLPDLYARPENPGERGAGRLVPRCRTSHGRDGKPQHFSRLVQGAARLADAGRHRPAVQQKLILSPVDKSPKECFKVLVRPDGSEYFLLENRTQGLRRGPAGARAC